MALAISAVATLYLLLILGFSVRLVDGGGPWFVTGHALEDGELFDATRNAVAFATFTIAGGAAYLAYRRQRATDRTNALTTSRYEQDELGELRARFTTAVEQLAHSSATVRIAGVYSLAAVADQWLANDDVEQAQVAVDVLCGYMRLPYSPDLGANHQTKRVVKLERSDAGEATEEHFEFPQNDRVVRQTICRLLASKLRGLPLRNITAQSQAAPGAWSDLVFDFSGAHLVGANFEACRFNEPVEFVEAVFEGYASFEGAHFAETAAFAHTKFQASATFSGASAELIIWFDSAEFEQRADFSGATFGRFVCLGAKFAGVATFSGATFVKEPHFLASSAREWDFTRATFEHGANFYQAAALAHVTFEGATLTRRIVFNNTETPAATRHGPDRLVEWDSPDGDGADFSDVEWLPDLTDEAPALSDESRDLVD
ncbi:pentapeptide repeat-containing protein (plasmid) [Prescottella equi]|uniref:Pentapeptide repeat-containing protein n=2 Tax=Rhodococcus hoagii TaxID=43767 RepID=A0A9Q4ZT40_RHOHA|nr:pentapeptide repeat-containing protein [Prescottella equi]MBM4487720.1 hypothetical protein [Prescottella equi]MBM4498418.1 hypothetical protein [Prescottella equi]MBM4507702.1 hypothetical protein [Prescottella equi]MBM4532477.1 hypothetical protein [Prescottella equi]MBM4538830.1 hypothetical protein [Prescottella equi]